MKKLPIKNAVIERLFDYFDSFDCEKGGAIVSKDGVIADFIPLKNVLEKPKSEYLFSFYELNELITPYFEKGYLLAGFIHSHNGGYLSLSKGDKDFFLDFMKENSNYKSLLTPIISSFNGKKKIKWWRLFFNGDLEEIRGSKLL